MNMALCQRCNKAKATVHITDTAPVKRERHLCEQCAEKEGIIYKHQHQAANAILQEFIKQKTGGVPAEDLVCPRCGLSFKEFQSKGMLGCPNDYEVFRKPLRFLLERAHAGHNHHIGKVPPSANETVHKETNLARLRRELEEAIEGENYELAAKVRDQIRLMESP